MGIGGGGGEAAAALGGSEALNETLAAEFSLPDMVSFPRSCFWRLSCPRAPNEGALGLKQYLGVLV